jgi:hypothetical protein
VVERALSRASYFSSGVGRATSALILSELLQL